MRNIHEVLHRLILQAQAAKACLDANLEVRYNITEISQEWTLQLGDFTIIDRRPAPMDWEKDFWKDVTKIPKTP